jgi:hypothetical protein
VDGQQQDSAAESALKACLEKVDKRHVNFTDGDSFNFHSV